MKYILLSLFSFVCSTSFAQFTVYRDVDSDSYNQDTRRQQSTPQESSKVVKAYYIKDNEYHPLRIRIVTANIFSMGGSSMRIEAYFNPQNGVWTPCVAGTIRTLQAFLGDSDKMEYFTYESYIQGYGKIWF